MGRRVGQWAQAVPRAGGDSDRLLRGHRCGGHGPRKSGEAEGMRRMVMSTPVSISAAPPIGSQIGMRGPALWAGFALLRGSLGARVHMRPSPQAEKNARRACASRVCDR